LWPTHATHTLLLLAGEVPCLDTNVCGLLASALCALSCCQSNHFATGKSQLEGYGVQKLCCLYFAYATPACLCTPICVCWGCGMCFLCAFILIYFVCYILSVLYVEPCSIGEGYVRVAVCGVLLVLGL